MIVVIQSVLIDSYIDESVKEATLALYIFTDEINEPVFFVLKMGYESYL